MNERFRAFVYGTVLAAGIGWVLYVGKDVFVPIVFSVLVVYVIVGFTGLVFRLPLVGRLLPRGLGYALSALVIVLALAVIGSLIAARIGGVIALAPQYASSLLNAVADVSARLGVEVTPTWATLRQDLVAQIGTQRLIGSTVVSVSSILSALVVVLLYVAFLLLELRVIPGKIDNLSSDPQKIAQVRKIIGHINARIGAYLALKTLVSAVLGLASWAILELLGVEFAAFWAVLIGLLNFVPYIGSVLGVAVPVAFATVQFADLDTVLAVLLSLSAAQFVIGFFLEPYLMGNSLNLSPFVILASLAAWTALWGLPGAFLAVPVTASMVLMFAEFPGTRGIAILLSRDGRV